MIPLANTSPNHRTPWVTRGLIAVCVIMFLYQLVLSFEDEHILILRAGAIPAVILGTRSLSPELMTAWPDWVTIFSSLFLHGGFLHLGGNMMFLWVFGTNVEDAMGHVRFLIFYLLCGLAATLAHIALDPSSVIPLIGASGAISGVLGAYIMLYPKAKVTAVLPLGFLFIPFRLAAWLVLGGWFGVQIFNVLMSGTSSNVAWMAHIGGFVVGMAAVMIFKDRNHRLFTDGNDVYVGPWSRNTLGNLRFNRPYRRVPNEHAVPVTRRPDSKPTAAPDDHQGPWGPRP